MQSKSGFQLFISTTDMPTQYPYCSDLLLSIILWNEIAECSARGKRYSRGGSMETGTGSCWCSLPGIAPRRWQGEKTLNLSLLQTELGNTECTIISGQHFSSQKKWEQNNFLIYSGTCDKADCLSRLWKLCMSFAGNACEWEIGRSVLAVHFYC